MVVILLATAVNEFIIFISIGFNFKLARQAGLNIGVAEAIWAINPFFQSVVDLFLYKNQIMTYHWVGMSIFVIAAVVVSLSNVVYKAKDDTEIHTTPIYAAVLSSFIMPITAVTFGMLAKYAMLKKKLNSNDFNFSYMLIMYAAALIVAIFHFWEEPGSFNKDNFTRGFIGSAINTFGCLFMNYAINTG